MSHGVGEELRIVQVVKCEKTILSHVLTTARGHFSDDFCQPPHFMECCYGSRAKVTTSTVLPLQPPPPPSPPAEGSYK